MTQQNRSTIFIGILAIFYIVGVFGMMIDINENFILLTPGILLVSTAVLILNHPEKDIQLWIFLIVSFLFGFFIEVVGVKTGLVFGEYQYGGTLGVKIFDVPPMIGVNWAMLTYAAAIIGNHFLKANDFVKALFGTALLIILDLLIEPVAPVYDFWSWGVGHSPVQNYIAWAVISWVLIFVFYKLLGKVKNPVAIALYVLQVLFFAFLNIINP